jgi:UDP-N-acetylmuramoylalanine--D-glutamate ligase
MKVGARTKASVYTFSCTRKVTRGAYLQADQLIIKSDGNKQFILHRLEIPIPGLHNVENVLAASCAAALLKVQANDIARAIKSFKAVEHRLEFIADVDGVSYFNDSKATNLDSLEKALLSFDKPLILIAGGQYNKNNYNAMVPLVSSKVKGLILLGEAKPYMAHAWAKAVQIVALVHNMSEAVSAARKLARQGDVVLLSPGCKSFDQYENFEQRGNNFKNLVRKIARAAKGSYYND